MARKKQDEEQENTEVTQTEQPETASGASETDSDTESTQAASNDGAEDGENSIVGNAVDAVSSAVETVAEGAKSVAGAIAGVVTGDGNGTDSSVHRGNRAQKIGIVTSDKMTKTVVVRVDRQIMHPKYRRYVRRTSKFMAHDEKGAAIGDKVRIIETRPLSARKRWRVVEIIQKAAR
jgi:small subunit ribosomal protein S17